MGFPVAGVGDCLLSWKPQHVLATSCVIGSYASGGGRTRPNANAQQIVLFHGRGPFDDGAARTGLLVLDNKNRKETRKTGITFARVHTTSVYSKTDLTPRSERSPETPAGKKASDVCKYVYMTCKVHAQSAVGWKLLLRLAASRVTANPLSASRAHHHNQPAVCRRN